MDKKADIYTIPQTLNDRDNLRKVIKSFMDSLSLTPPLSLKNLHQLSEQLICEHGLDSGMKGWVMVEINNCVWSDIVSSVPYEKRILLLPQCLSRHGKCEAKIDELGLLCHRCMACTIPDLQDKADSLGIMSIVAEGFTSVVGLVESGTVDTVIGVGCLDSLEKAFPLLINNAVPGFAIPLNKSGCRDTDVDCGYVDYRLTDISDKAINLVDYRRVKDKISQWFTTEGLEEVLGPAKDHTSSVAREWLAGNGKRWRPYILLSMYMAVNGCKDAKVVDTEDAGLLEIPEKVRYAAIAVECFHKASLVHDDIQDEDKLRYNEPTVYAKYGTPIAINTGDFLLGEGYKALTLCGDIELVKVISSAHISLCKGQGMELQWEQFPEELTMDYVLEIFRNKTVPAFEVALDMGVLCNYNEDNSKLRQLLHDYSTALGIAYQLQDDLEDFSTDEPLSLRPSSVLAALCEQNKEYGFIKALSKEQDIKSFFSNDEQKPLLQKALERVKLMAEDYRNQAIDTLDALDNIEVKRLLFRVTEKVLFN